MVVPTTGSLVCETPMRMASKDFYVRILATCFDVQMQQGPGHCPSQVVKPKRTFLFRVLRRMHVEWKAFVCELMQESRDIQVPM